MLLAISCNLLLWKTLFYAGRIPLQCNALEENSNLLLKSQHTFISLGRKTCHLNADTRQRKLHLLRNLIQSVARFEVFRSKQSSFVHSINRRMTGDSRTSPSIDISLFILFTQISLWKTSV